MTDIIKSLGCMEDMSQGIDSENQVRNGVSYSVRKLPIPYPVATEAEITALDVATYILARLFTGDVAKDYIYKEFDLTGIPSTGDGTWIPLLSDGVGDLAITVGATYVSDTSFTILGDYTLQLPEGTYPTLTTDVGGIAKSTVLSSSFNGTVTLVTVAEEVVLPNLASASISNYAEVLRLVIESFETEAAEQLEMQSDSFQNRFAFSQPTLPWPASTLISDPLQLYSTGTIGESGYSVWLADPALLPFTTSATFAEDELLGRWTAATVATQEWTTKQSIARSRNIKDIEVVFHDDTNTLLDNIKVIYVQSTNQAVWLMPYLDSIGKTIVSVVGDQLTTTGGSGSNTYTLISPTEKKLTISVPTEQATLQDAVDFALDQYQQGSKIVTINIEAGHAPDTGVLLVNVDAGFITIASTDAVVTVGASWADADNFISALNAVAPVLGCKVDMALRGEKGYALEYSSRGRVLEYCGVDNAGGLTTGEGAGLFLNSACVCSAGRSIFNGSYRNMWVAHESICYADFANADYATGDAGVYCARASQMGLSYGSASNCAGNGIRCRRAYLLCMAVDAYGNGTDGAGYGILSVEGATVIASQGAGVDTVGADLSNNKQGAINCDASYVLARNSNLKAGTNTDSANAVISSEGGKVNVTDSDLSGIVGNEYVRAIAAVSSEIIAENTTMDNNTAEAVRGFGSTIDLTNAVITGSQRGISAQRLSNINAAGVTITGSLIHGILSQGGSKVFCGEGSITGSVTDDLRIEQGGQIIAHNCATTGGGSPTIADTNVVAFNTIYSVGIIWA